MRKVIGAINMTLDGVCDHTAISPDAEVHDHYTALLAAGGEILYGRITYELMQFWQELLKKPSGEKSMDDFALAMDKIEKVDFSHTLKDTGWESASLAKNDLAQEVLLRKQQAGKDIFVGSRSLIIQLLKLNLLDELQLCIHPIIAGKGLPLFENMQDRAELKLLKTKTFASGAVLIYYGK
jgi:dihydrofolate reductase